ncbi:MAG: DUF3868 domain-containing protein [Alistipes sp.]|nr:DUF3868 domain-containing protein [Alistipes sp.]
MKQIYKNLFIVCVAALSISASQAQNAVTTNGVRISDIEMERSGNHLNVGMTLDMSDLHVRSNRSLQITPIVTNGNEIYQLPAVVIDGRRRSIVHKREEMEFVDPTNTYIRRYNRTEQATEYDVQVPYEAWMDNSELILREEWTSCHDAALSEELIAIAEISQPQSQPSTTTPTSSISTLPRMAYAIPTTSDATQSEQSSIDILFAVNQSNINAAFMDNKEQIDELRKALANSSDIKEIHLTGYASPEGPYEFNKALAARRAESVKKYLANNNLSTTTDVVVHSYPANWDEVKRLLNDTYIENWQGITAIIDDASISAADKNSAIRKKYPVEYEFMLRSWYPKLRITDITINHKKRDLSVNEAKRILRNNPSQLSLEDIYMIAITYEKGSKEWDEIILLAVENYPQSPEARVNAANVAMANGDYAKAAQYLQGLPTNMPEAINSRGILAMSQGNYAEALNLFEQAQRAGVSEAAYNITLVRELMNAKQ